MKYIIAIIQPSKLENVRTALLEVGVNGLTASEVRGYGRQKGKTENYRGKEYETNFLPKIKVEIAVTADISEKVIKTLKENATTDKIGDGKIFEFDLDQVIRIRTGETGADAI